MDSDLKKFEQYIDVQKPVCNLVDKITSSGQVTGDKHTAGQERLLNTISNKHESALKILAIKYVLPLSLIHIFKFCEHLIAILDCDIIQHLN